MSDKDCKDLGSKPHSAIKLTGQLWAKSCLHLTCLTGSCEEKWEGLKNYACHLEFFKAGILKLVEPVGIYGISRRGGGDCHKTSTKVSQACFQLGLCKW